MGVFTELTRILGTLILYVSCLNAAKPMDSLPATVFQSSYPYITGSTIRSYSDHILDWVTVFDPRAVKTGDTIFIMIDFLEKFFSEYHSQIQNSYIIITAHYFDESDDDVPGKFMSYLNDNKLVGWFTHNADTIHPKIHPMPIGIASSHYCYGDTRIFNESIKLFAANQNRKNLLYMNFSMHSTNQKCAFERKAAYDHFIIQKWCTGVFDTYINDAVCRKTMSQYLKEMAQHKFVVSPRGNGLDCFRTWEALLMGCYPIVITSTLDRLFDDLPVVIVNSWSDVTEYFLNQKYAEFSSKSYNLDKLYMPYWLERIRELQELTRK